MSGPAIHATFGEDTARARRSDPETSHEAADVNDVTSSIGAVLDILRTAGPMTDERLVALLSHTPFTEQRLRTAREALVKKGLAKFTERWGQTSRGRRARIWAAIDYPVALERHLDPLPDLRECGACEDESVVEVDRWAEGGHVFEAWHCPSCGHWNDREVRP